MSRLRKKVVFEFDESHAQSLEKLKQQGAIGTGIDREVEITQPDGTKRTLVIPSLDQHRCPTCGKPR